MTPKEAHEEWYRTVNKIVDDANVPLYRCPLCLKTWGAHYHSDCWATRGAGDPTVYEFAGEEEQAVLASGLLRGLDNSAINGELWNLHVQKLKDLK